MHRAPFLLAFALSSPLLAQSQLRDINSVSPPEQNASSSPGDWLVRGGVAYCFAEGSPYPFNHSYQVAGLWRTDGTAGGTTLLKEFDPGETHGRGFSPVDVGGTILFVAQTGGTYTSLWRSDGTAAGTVPIPGTLMSQIVPVTLWNGLLWFVGTDTMYTNTRKLWRSDGTAAGTVVVVQLPAHVDHMQASGALLYLTVAGSGLWRSDGTAAGTALIPGTGSLTPHDLVDVNGRLFFTSDDFVVGRELWTSDGTAAGTVMVRDINPGAASSMPGFPASILGNLGGMLLFSADDGTNGMELWRSDGTAAGTTLVLDIAAGTTGSAPDALAVVGGVAWFGAATPASGRELWRSDGTAAGTTQVVEIAPGSASASPLAITDVNGTLFFAASDTTARGHELWKSDGTAAGTVLVRDIAPGPVDSWPNSMVALGSSVLFAANNGPSTASNYELWTSDGTTAGTTLLRDLRPRQPSSMTNTFGNSRGAPLGDRRVFAADDGVNGMELWISDGTPAGTVLLKDIRAGTVGSAPEDLVHVAGTVYFTAHDGVRGREVWKTDGTTAGTVLMQDLWPGSAGSRPLFLATSGGKLFWNAEDSTGAWLWTSDGSPAGAVRLQAPGATGPRFPSILVDVNGVLFTVGSDNTNVANLWTSDGTAAGTVKVRTLPGDRFPRVMSGVAVGSRFFFVADDGSFSGRGYELWRSDGTAAGTILVRDIAPGFQDSFPSQLTEHGGILYFTANDLLHPGDLWRSDGTAAGTFKVKTINPTGTYSTVGSMVSAGGTLFFSAFETATGNELWKSDGTAAGTVLVQDINPGMLGSMPPVRTRLIAGSGARIVFAASDGQSGVEVWTSDGTAAGTVRVADLAPGPSGSDPDAFARAGTNLFFAASDGATGREPYVLPLGALAAPLVETFGTACPGSGGRRPRIGASGLPTIGGTFTPTLANAFGPAPCALFLHSVRTALPLGGGCTLYVPPPIPLTLTTGTDGAGNAAFPLALPDSSALIGLQLFWQWTAFDPAGSYLNTLTFSDGLAVLIGQ